MRPLVPVKRKYAAAFFSDLSYSNRLFRCFSCLEEVRAPNRRASGHGIGNCRGNRFNELSHVSVDLGVPWRNLIRATHAQPRSVLPNARRLD